MALERNQADYGALFEALGFALHVDGRGFAFFDSEEGSAQLTQNSRKLALLFLVLFDTQADAGQALGRFEDWLIDRELLEHACEQHQEILQAEGMDADGLAEVLGIAVRYGFARSEGGGWRLLPAVCRYLDHFEALAAECRAEQGEDDDFEAEDDPRGGANEEE